MTSSILPAGRAAFLAVALLAAACDTEGDGIQAPLHITSEAPDTASAGELFTYQVEVELKTTRALRSDEGRPIAQIRTPGRPADPARRVDIEIGVDA